MSKLDGLIQELAIHKQLFFMFVGAALATLGWAATHRDQPDFVLFGAILVTLGASVFALTRFKRMYKLIQEIKDA